MDPNTTQTETNPSEFHTRSQEINVLNGKRTYDEFQDLSLTLARRALNHYSRLDLIAERALTNGLTIDHIVNAQSIRDNGLVTDDVLNPVTQGTGNAITGTTGVASNGVAATIPADSNATIISVLNNLTAQLGELAQLIQNSKQSTTAG